MKSSFIAELIGTFCLVFCGCAAIIVNDQYNGALGHLGVCLVFGLIVLSMIYSIGNVSGAHMNPAVTIGFWAARKLPAKSVVPYVVAQCLGAIAAAFLLNWLFPGHPNTGATLPAIGLVRCFALETILSAILMFIILNVSIGHMEKGIMAGVAVGGYIALAALLGGPASGASMNPARSLGPALASGQWSGLWIYLTAPILGTLAATRLCPIVQGKDCCKD